MTDENLEKAHFDPAPLPSDLTIEKYYERIRAQLPQDREQLHFSIPFEDQLNDMKSWEEVRNELKQLESKHGDKITELERKHGNKITELERKHGNDIKELERNLGEYKREANEEKRKSEKKAQKERMERFGLFLGNMLISLSRKLAKQYRPAIANDPSTPTLQQFVISMKDEQFRAAGVPTKVWPFLRKINKVCTLNISPIKILICC